MANNSVRVQCQNISYGPCLLSSCLPLGNSFMEFRTGHYRICGPCRLVSLSGWLTGRGLAISLVTSLLESNYFVNRSGDSHLVLVLYSFAAPGRPFCNNDRSRMVLRIPMSDMLPWGGPTLSRIRTRKCCINNINVWQDETTSDVPGTRTTMPDGLVQFLYTPRLLPAHSSSAPDRKIFFKGQKITVAGFGFGTSLYAGSIPVVSVGRSSSSSFSGNLPLTLGKE